MPKSKAELGLVLRLTAPEKIEGTTSISYSQFSMWSVCPLKWKLQYIDKIKSGGPSIHTTFGTSFHETIQYWLHTLFTKSAKDADQINLNECLQERMFENYAIDVESSGGEHFSSSQELAEFYSDGSAILEYIRKHRSEYFSSRKYELIGIEIPLYYPASTVNSKVMMSGFLDIVFRDIESNRILILDFKTSTAGWNKYQKADKLKTSQLVLYKSYFAKQFGYDVDTIDIEYFIVRRKLPEGSMYPVKRVQSFIPSSGNVTRNKLQKEVDEFVKTCFTDSGERNNNITYQAISNKGKNCKYCFFADKNDLCPKSNRI